MAVGKQSNYKPSPSSLNLGGHHHLKILSIFFIERNGNLFTVCLLPAYFHNLLSVLQIEPLLRNDLSSGNLSHFPNIDPSAFLAH